MLRSGQLKRWASYENSASSTKTIGDQMMLPLKDRAKLNQTISRIQGGQFDANDIDGLLMKLRPYACTRTVFLEVAHFVAHPDARDRGVAQQSLTAMADSMRFFVEYVSGKKSLILDAPFPSYVYRLFLSQTRLSDERRLKAEFKVSHSSLIKKIESNFTVDRKTDTCSLRTGKGGSELIAALQYVTGFIHSRPAFHVRDFHQQMKEVMHAQGVNFDEQAWDAQTDRISLAILCLMSNTTFALNDGSRASCKLETENHFRILSGQRRLPTGSITSEPSSFGSLIILGVVTIKGSKGPLPVSFPLIDTNLNPYDHCDPSLFLKDHTPNELGEYEIEIINLATDMSLSQDYKLVRTDSLVQ